jgi:hypothetical protein
VQDGIPDLNANRLADLEDEFARNARQDPGINRRREDNAGFHDRQICRCALGELAAVVPHHAFERPAANGLLHRQRGVHQVVALDHRVHRQGLVDALAVQEAVIEHDTTASRSSLMVPFT